MAKAFWDIDLGRVLEGPSRRGARRMADGLGWRMSHCGRGSRDRDDRWT